MHSNVVRSLASSDNRRRSERHPVGFYVDQFVGDDAYRCFTRDLSSIGLYMERLASPIDRPTSLVQLEITLPNLGESIWAGGEVVYDRIDTLFHGSAVRFTRIARTHQRWLREWLRESYATQLFAERDPMARAPQVRIHRPVRAACA